MSVLEYQPDVGQLLRLLEDRGARRVLLLGTGEMLDIPAGEVRHAEPPGPVMPRGVYVFGGATVDVIVCGSGSQPVDAQRIPIAETDPEHSLRKAYGWFDVFWPKGTPVGPGPRFVEGDHALIAGSDDVARIERCIRVDGRNAYEVTVHGKRQTVSEDGLKRLDLDADDPRSWLKSPAASATELAVGLTVTKLTNPLTDTIYSYLSSKTVFRPYQFRPVLRMLASPQQRLLIADEVGLGKTIEAGLIWTELEARSARMTRVLVVCPAMLVPKWKTEMRRRFDRELVELDKVRLQELVDAFRAGDDAKQIHAVVSLERLRSSRLLADLAELQPRFDLVIVDEAHYLRNRTTMSHELGRHLSDWADAMVFLSATPLNLGTDDLFNLLSLLVEEDFVDHAVFPQQVEPNRHLNAVARDLLANRDTPHSLLPTLERVHACELGAAVTNRPEYDELAALLRLDRPLDWRELATAKRLVSDLNTLSNVLTRTRKVDVPDAKAVREPHSIEVEWTPAELDCYQTIVRWARQRARASGGIPGFATQMPLRQAASCLPVFKQLLLERDATLTQHSDEADDFDDYVLDEGPDDDTPLTPRDVNSVLEAMGEVDTKFDQFVTHLDEARRLGSGQVLVFSFFRRTLGYLERRLADLGHSVRVMHGGVRVPERQQIMNDFRDGRFDILLSSEVGSEGLDFEFCNVLVNYDLPWNPMKVEQRIGRLDRFGQTSEKIFIFNFHVPGTIESEIFDRLYLRINVFRESIGELEPILRGELNELTRVALDPQLSADQRQRRIDEIEVAIEERSKQLDDLDEARSLLAGLDQLLIDGFEEDKLSRGRFVGPTELRVLVTELLADLGDGQLLDRGKNSTRHQLVGSTALADVVERAGVIGTASLYRPGELMVKLRDEEPIEVTFSNEEASRTGVELLSLRHPVVRAAAKHFDERPVGLKRCASVRLPGVDVSRRLVVVVYLARTTGLRPALELWPVAVDLATGEVDDEVGFALLAAVASGGLEDGAPFSPADIEMSLDLIQQHAVRLQMDVEADRRRSNAALVESRAATQRASFERKIARARQTLDLVRAERKGGAALERMHASRVANLELRLAELIGELELGRDLAVTLHPVAVAVAAG